MPNVADYDTEDEWMAACVPTRIDEGDEQDQAVAVCLNIWRNRNKAMDAYKMTKGELLDAAERELSSSVINRISRADGTMGDLALELNRHRAMHTSNNILKTIRRSPYELTVGNHIILFGGRDLEGRASPNVNADGSLGEYFTADTVLESPYTKAGAFDVDWEHSQGELGDAVIGVVDWKTARVDDLGVFVERVLDRKNRYIQLLEQLGWFRRWDARHIVPGRSRGGRKGGGRQDHPLAVGARHHHRAADGAANDPEQPVTGAEGTRTCA